MRYVKVLLAVVLFFFVMLFFVQNQASFSQQMMLKLDVLFFTIETAKPVYFYTLLLASFLLGGLACFLMLVWDRLALIGRVSLGKMKVRGLERDVAKAGKMRTIAEKSLQDTKTKLAELETNLRETQAENKAKLTENDAQLRTAQAKNTELEKALAAVPQKQ